MDTTSPQGKINWIDIKSMLKNLAIFFIPMSITLLTAVQSGQEITWAFVYWLLLSTCIKMWEYFLRDNTKVV